MELNRKVDKKEAGKRIKGVRSKMKLSNENDTTYKQDGFVLEVLQPALNLSKFKTTNGKIIKINGSDLSRVENGSEAKEEKLYIAICTILGIEIPWKNTQLAVAFSQGFWAAPLIWINERLGTDTFWEEVKLSTYADKEKDKEPHWSNQHKLARFDKEKNVYFHSGQILKLLREQKIDIGFLGSTVVGNKKDVIRIARIADANLLRHTIVFIAPKDRFKDRKEVIRYLLTKPEKGKECQIFYPPNSTAEQEYIQTFQFVGHERRSLEISDLSIFEQEFSEIIEKENANPIAFIGLMATPEIAERIAQDVGKDKIQIFTFRTIEIIDMMPEMGIVDKKIDNMYYEMVTQHDKTKIKQLATTKGFKLLLKELNNAIEELNTISPKDGIPTSHESVADFLGHEKKDISEMLFKAKFELLFYPEWLNIVLEIGKEDI